MAIGNFGSEIVFEVSDSKIQTFKNYSESMGARWADHSIQGRLPVSEFLGAELMTVSMTVELSAAHGVKPWSVRDRLAKALRNGVVAPLVIGGRQPSSNKFKLTNIQNVFEQVLNDGKVSRITMNLTFKEQVE